MVQERLERLRNLPLRGFNEIDEDTPSSGTASLPTPLLDTGQLPNPVALANATPLAPQEPAVGLVQPPGAPLLKDHDSFSDGSRAGSFGFLSSASGDLCYPINTMTTEVMGESSNSTGLTVGDVTHLDDSDASMSIEEWRANVALDASAQSNSLLPSSSSSTTKRRRSPTPEVVRRIRPRARSLSSASSATNDFDWFAPIPEVLERPPSRACSAPD
ncbi:hypothetical protein APHAL10511_006718 [Amanita phalloides]|nr:hypothetical protein APHAL10511_006718 [Amanita phalloides]